MNFVRITKRVALFLLVNLLVMTTITVLASLLGVNRYFEPTQIKAFAGFCLLYGFAGAFISLALSRVMAKWMMGVRVIPSDTHDPELRELVETVHEFAQRAGLPAMPEVGIYESPEPNAFATGPSRSRSLVAVSTGLMQRMRRDEVAGVLAHEVAHIANGDMVTMTLIQGVVNAFALFLSRILAFVIGQFLRSRSDRDSGGGLVEWLLALVFQVVFMMLGWIVVSWFSRKREFRADAWGAAYSSRANMVGALAALQRLHDPELAAASAKAAPAFQAMKISGHPSGFLALFSTHPPLEERIARLQQASR